MFNVNNKSAINRLAIKSFKANKTRNIVAIIAIILTAIMFTSVFTVGAILIKSIEQSNFRQVGSYSHGSIKGVAYDDIEVLSEHPLVAEHNVSRMLGLMTKDEFLKNPTQVQYSDETYAKHGYAEFIQGTIPKENTMEFACDTNVLTALGVEPIIGTEVTLTIELFGDVTITDTFVLSGYWQRDEISSVSFVYLPRSYVDKTIAENPDTKELSSIYGRIEMGLLLKDSNNISADITQIIEDNGFDSSDENAENYLGFGVNWGYTNAQANANFDLATILLVALLFSIFIISAYLIIFNLFKISITNDIKFYGLLKTIGVTAKQTRKIIYKQALMLCIIGIPIGLITGYLLGCVISPLVLSTLSTNVIAFTINPYIFIGGGLFAFFTVFVSCIKPAKIAGKISPIEAVKYTENTAIKSKTHKTKKVSACSMAFANMGRNKGKSIMVITSLSFALLIFQLSFMFANGFSMEKYLSNFTVGDFLVGHAEYFNFRFYSASTLGQEDISVIENIDGIEQSGVTYGEVGSYNTAYYDAATIKEANSELIERYSDEFGDEYAQAQQSVTEKRQEMLGIDENGNIQNTITLYGMDNLPLEKLQIIEGSVENMGENSIIAIVRDDDYGNPIISSNSFNVGDTVKIRHSSDWLYYNLETDELMLTSDWDANAPFYLVSDDYTEVEYTVAAVAIIPYSLSMRSYNVGEEIFVLPTETALQNCHSLQPMNLLLEAENDKIADITSFLENYTTSVNTQLDFESTEKAEAEFENFKNMFLLVGLFLSSIIGFIGILNFFNVILTSINTRKQEFAMLQSIGMTGKQLKNMLICESLSYIITTIFITTVLTIIVAPITQDVFGSILWFYEANYTILPIAISLPVFIFIGVILPMILYKILAKQSIVERLRGVE